ncbi:hypothetical protein CapIbe_009034 [Capra ibex]
MLFGAHCHSLCYEKFPQVKYAGPSAAPLMCAEHCSVLTHVFTSSLYPSWFMEVCEHQDRGHLTISGGPEISSATSDPRNFSLQSAVWFGSGQMNRVSWLADNPQEAFEVFGHSSRPGCFPCGSAVCCLVWIWSDEPCLLAS